MNKRELYCSKCKEHEWICKCLDKEKRIKEYDVEKARPYALLFILSLFTWILGFGALSVWLFQISVLFGAITLVVAFIIPLIFIGVIAI